MKKIMPMGSSSPDSVHSSSFDRKDLTEDIWFEIFLRLYYSNIFEFRIVSESWFSILSNPYFVKKWYKHNNQSLPWLLFSYADLLEQDQSQDNILRRRFFTSAYDFRRSYPQSDFLWKFLVCPFFPNTQKTENKFLVGVSCGLFLCTTSIYNQITYYVCNPLTEKWVSLPPPPPRDHNRVVVGILCNQCDSASLVSKSYKVIRIPKFAAAAKDFQVEIFSSATGEWNVYDVSCPQYVTWDSSLLRDNLLTHNGDFYWFQQRNHNIIAVPVDINTNNGTCRSNECRWINMPDREMDGGINYLSECLGESEGMICFARLNKKERSLSAWVLDGDCWYMLHKDIHLQDWLAKLETQLLEESGGVDLITEIEVVGFSPVDKNVVILSSQKYIWAYNTMTRVYEQECHPEIAALHQQVAQHFHHFIGLNINIDI